MPRGPYTKRKVIDRRVVKARQLINGGAPVYAALARARIAPKTYYDRVGRALSSDFAHEMYRAQWAAQ